MKKTIIIIAGIVAVVAAMGWVLVGNKKKIDEKNVVVDRSKIPVAVAVEKATTTQFSGAMEFVGSLEMDADANVVVSAPGKIKTLNVSKGMFVRKGQILGNVESDQLYLKLKALNLTVDKLEVDLNRVRTLVEGNAAPSTNLKDLEYNLASTQIQIEQVKQQIADNNILAPISGQVTDKMMEAGEFANPGAPIAKIVDVSTLNVAVFVNEKHIYKLGNGQSATISADVIPGESFTGKVKYISPVGDENHNYRVEVELDAAGTKVLRAGTYVKVGLGSTQASKGLTIPARALLSGSKIPSVYLAKGENAELREIVVGRREGEIVEVISGLEDGDAVVVAGQINLKDGSLISVAK